MCLGEIFLLTQLMYTLNIATCIIRILDNLKQAILSRNNKNWHSLDEIEGIDDDWDDITDTSPPQNQRQNSLERNNSFFPWSTPKPSNATIGTNRRRRMSSVSRATAARIHVLQERQNDDDCTSSTNSRW